tara:strand:- start:296 stop:523 length:228 start_codon:yes stop_codon:yes gene_type:complete
MEFVTRPAVALAKFFAQRKIGDAFIRPTAKFPQILSREYLTEGVAQGAKGQQLINVLGRASGQGLVRKGREDLGQ